MKCTISLLLWEVMKISLFGQNSFHFFLRILHIQHLARVSSSSSDLCLVRVLPHLKMLATAGCRLLLLAAENQRLGVSSALHVTSFSWKAAPPTGIPQSSVRCRGSRQSPSRASPKLTLFSDQFSSRNDVFQVVLVVAYADWMNHCLCLKLCKPDFSVISSAVIASSDS